jgi:phage shock protein B
MNWDLVVIFTFVIVLTAVRAHYRGRGGTMPVGLAGPDQNALDRAMDVARRLEQRVETLERLLDEDAPGWRARVRA